MGLAEKRAIKEFQDTMYPGLTKEVHDACGFQLEIDVNWETVTEDGMAHMINDSIAKVYFEPVIEALKELCADDMGKEALKSGLKKVIFCNTKGAINPRDAISFANGVLEVNHQPYSNIDDVADRRKQIVKLVEAAL